jgi:ribose transport system ATP-binding protein/inositol transport system ATP-binding protein
MEINEYAVEMFNISKTFPGAKVLKNVDFRLKRGEVHALVGENGAGKSTLIKILGGIYEMDRDGGSIKINAKTAVINSVTDAQRFGIAVMHQEISLVSSMTVADNLFMGREILGKGGFFIDDAETQEKAKAILGELELDVDVDEKVGRLSIAKQQLVEVCRALLVKAKIIIMDEPTSSLTKTEIDQLFNQIKKLKKNDISIIYISHRMDEIFTICDTVTVMRDGEYIGTDATVNLDKDKIISMMVGRKLSDVYHHKSYLGGNEVCLQVEGYKNRYLKNVSFSLKKGEILGFAGLIGAGRTELAHAIFGVDRVESGEMCVNGKSVNIKDIADAIKLGIGYVPEDRKSEGLVLIHSIQSNVSISVLEKFIKFITVNHKYEDKLIEDYKNKLSIRMVDPTQKVQFLSGGNQQKVVLAKWMATEPEIFIFDEPTRGIDVGAKADIYKLIEDLAAEGKSIMFISSEMEEIINLSDRIIVMHEGEITGEIDNREVSETRQSEIMRLAAGGK